MRGAAPMNSGIGVNLSLRGALVHRGSNPLLLLADGVSWNGGRESGATAMVESTRATRGRDAKAMPFMKRIAIVGPLRAHLTDYNTVTMIRTESGGRTPGRSLSSLCHCEARHDRSLLVIASPDTTPVGRRSNLLFLFPIFGQILPVRIGSLDQEDLVHP